MVCFRATSMAAICSAMAMRSCIGFPSLVWKPYSTAAIALWRVAGNARACFNVLIVIPGWCEGDKIEGDFAPSTRPGISRFRARLFEAPRNDDAEKEWIASAFALTRFGGLLPGEARPRRAETGRRVAPRSDVAARLHDLAAYSREFYF